MVKGSPLELHHVWGGNFWELFRNRNGLRLVTCLVEYALTVSFMGSTEVMQYELISLSRMYFLKGFVSCING